MVFGEVGLYFFFFGGGNTCYLKNMLSGSKLWDSKYWIDTDSIDHCVMLLKCTLQYKRASIKRHDIYIKQTVRHCQII